MAKLVCIVCPKGCRLVVNPAAGYTVSGNQCPRGKTYAIKELQNPTRTLTFAVKISGAALPMLPVKTKGQLAKKDIQSAAKLLHAVQVSAPVKLGDVIVENILGSGVDVVATRSMQKTE